MNPETPSDAIVDEYVGEMISKAIQALTDDEAEELARRQDAGEALIEYTGEDETHMHYTYAGMISIKVDKLRLTPGRHRATEN